MTEDLPTPDEILVMHDEIEAEYDLKYKGVRAAAPTLILYGEHETSIISRHAPTLSAQIPDSIIQEVPDAGHASPWDNPEFFNSTIQTFLTSQTLIKAE